MFSVRPHPEDAPWGEAVRIEVDPAERIRGLRFFRNVASVGTAAVGLALFGISLVVLRGSGALPPIVYFGCVGALLAFSPGCWFALTLNLQRIPDRIAFDDRRVMVHQMDGLVREVAWADPDLALELLNLGGSDFTRGTILLSSRMRSARFDAAITVEGAAALQAEAVRQGLYVDARTQEKSANRWGVVELRRAPPADATSSGAPTQTPPEGAPTTSTGLPEGRVEYGQ